MLDATLSDPTAVGVAVKLKSQAVSNATPTVGIVFYETGSATPIDPRNGATVYFKLELRNSTVG